MADKAPKWAMDEAGELLQDVLVNNDGAQRDPEGTPDPATFEFNKQMMAQALERVWRRGRREGVRIGIEAAKAECYRAYSEADSIKGTGPDADYWASVRTGAGFCMDVCDLEPDSVLAAHDGEE